MPFDVILAGALGLPVLLFALAGGADFGAGLWSLLARRGERATEQQQLIERAIGPLWEANELWVVVSAVILWSAFAPAFGLWDGALCPLRLGYCGRLVAWGVPGISHRGPGGGAESLRVLRGDLREHEHHHALLSGYGCGGHSLGEAPVERKRAPRRRILPALDRPFPDHCRPPRRGDLRVSLGDLLDHRRCR